MKVADVSQFVTTFSNLDPETEISLGDVALTSGVKAAHKCLQVCSKFERRLAAFLALQILRRSVPKHIYEDCFDIVTRKITYSKTKHTCKLIKIMYYDGDVSEEFGRIASLDTHKYSQAREFGHMFPPLLTLTPWLVETETEIRQYVKIKSAIKFRDQNPGSILTDYNFNEIIYVRQSFPVLIGVE